MKTLIEQLNLRRAIACVGVLMAAASLVACGGGGDSAPAPTNPTGFAGGAVSLQFAAQAGDAPVTCSAPINGLGTTNASARLRDLRFYVSNVRLLRADGGETPLALNVVTDDLWNARQGSDSVTLVDLEDNTGECAASGMGTSATNALINGSVPAGDYVGVVLTLGVPPSLNHLDPNDAQTPFALSSHALGWDWTTGRIFAKIEVADPARATSPTWGTPVFTAHLGAIGCTGDPALSQPTVCTRPNRVRVALGSASSPFDPTRHKIVLDVPALLAGNNVTINGGGASGCMSAPDDPECAAMFNALQLSLVDGQPINGGQAQTVFRAVAR
jgi:uncharacterized repeat protein (TIGR04052 family)